MEDTQKSSPLKQRYLEPDEQEEFKGTSPLRRRNSYSKARSPSPLKLHMQNNSLVNKRHATIARNQELHRLGKLNQSGRVSSPDSNSPLQMNTRKQRKKKASEFNFNK